MTFSIAGRCARTGMLGVAVSSSSPAVAARCAYARAGVGAALSQNITDPRLGQKLLAAMEAGKSAAAALEQVVAEAGGDAQFRQLVVLDSQGGTAIHRGAKSLGIHAGAAGADCAAAGNLLAHDRVPAAIVRGFAEGASLHLGERLIAAMEAGLQAGGEAGPVKSAGLLVVDKQSWPLVDLRCDWADDPIGELAKLWQVYAPQMNDYVTRALSPSSAPAFGVPGDP